MPDTSDVTHNGVSYSWGAIETIDRILFKLTFNEMGSVLAEIMGNERESLCKNSKHI